jgi:hypothetical protein
MNLEDFDETVSRTAMNEEWHKRNPMPAKATFEQRVAWHREHAAACGCRRPPADIERLLESESTRSGAISSDQADN